MDAKKDKLCSHGTTLSKANKEKFRDIIINNGEIKYIKECATGVNILIDKLSDKTINQLYELVASTTS